MNRQRFVIALLVAACYLPLGGCRSKHSGRSASQGPTYVYHLKGIVKALPVPMQGPPSMMIKMQPIPKWMGISGKVTPMAAMTMPCQLAKTVSATGLSVGDKIAFTYKVNWVRDRMLITHIKRLPRATVINFRLPATRP